MIDFGAFSEWWMDADCAQTNDCEGADFDASGDVGLPDLRHFCDYWLWGK